MIEASVIGLGVMGSALARALLRNGHRVTIWNRTSAKAEPLVREGAVLASSAASAVGASPIVIVCVADYKVTHSLLETKGVAPALAGRVLVQLSTDTPQEARDSEAWARARGADLAPVIGGMVKHGCEVIQRGVYDNPQSSVSICAAFFEGLAQQAREAQINAEFPTFGLGLFRRAMAAGHGQEEFAALIKVLRGVA